MKTTQLSLTATPGRGYHFDKNTSAINESLISNVALDKLYNIFGESPSGWSEINSLRRLFRHVQMLDGD